MSREIKFRVFDGEDMISPDYIDRDGYAHWRSNSIPSASNEIEQFTGLHDSKGVDIYEGDFLSHTNTPTEVWVVKFDGGSLIMENPAHTDIEGRFRISLYSNIGMYPDKWSIVSNIHESPDLLVSENKEKNCEE